MHLDEASEISCFLLAIAPSGENDRCLHTYEMSLDGCRSLEIITLGETLFLNPFGHLFWQVTHHDMPPHSFVEVFAWSSGYEAVAFEFGYSEFL